MKKYTFIIMAAFLLFACDDESTSKDSVCEGSSCSSQGTGNGNSSQPGDNTSVDPNPGNGQTTEPGSGNQVDPGSGSELSGGTTGPCGAHASCAAGYLCYDNLCKDAHGVLQGMACGNTVCKSTEVCINRACKDRTNDMSYAVDGMCDPNTFVERCVGNKVVYCATDSDENGEAVTLIRESDCSETPGYTCHVKAEGNFAFCARKESACSPEKAGRMTYCSVEQSPDGGVIAGAASYLTYYDCVPDTKGAYVAFIDENLATEDCPGVCLNEYVCESVTQNTGCKKSTCSGNIVNYCYENGDSYSLNCEYHGTTCIETSESADCDWDNASY